MTALREAERTGIGRHISRASLRSVAGNASATIGLATIAIFVVVAILAPALAPYDPLTLAGTRLQPPGAEHLMGTDDLGRDVFSRVVFGARVSLLIGVASAILAVVIGSFVGGIAGYFAGRVDDTLMRMTELFQIIPRFLLAMVVVSLFGPSQTNVIIVIGVLSWPQVARVVRAQVLVLRREEFVLAAIMAGATTPRVLVRHVLPNVLPFVIVAGSLQTGQAILVESGLSFLGLGNPLNPGWGLLLQQAQLYLATAWWMSVFPGLALAMAVVALNLAGDGLGEVLNPRRRHG